VPSVDEIGSPQCVVGGYGVMAAGWFVCGAGTCR